MSQGQNKTKNNFRKGSWSYQEHQQFVIESVGKEWHKMGDYVPTRSSTQIRSHGQKYFGKLQQMFQSKQILGEEFETIKGPLNDREYKIYLDIGKIYFRFWNVPEYFWICLHYLVKPKPKLVTGSTNSDHSEVQPIDSIKYQFFDIQSQSNNTPCLPFKQQIVSMQVQATPKKQIQQGYFTQTACQQFKVQNINSVNFFQTFVDKSSSSSFDSASYQQFINNYPTMMNQKGFVAYNRRSAPQMETRRFY